MLIVAALDEGPLESLMVAQWEPGKYAPWIAEPKTRINKKPGNFEWVKLAE